MEDRDHGEKAWHFSQLIKNEQKKTKERASKLEGDRNHNKLSKDENLNNAQCVVR